MKILSAILLIVLFASCASYHDGQKKGIFLKNNAPLPVYGTASPSLEPDLIVLSRPKIVTKTGGH